MSSIFDDDYHIPELAKYSHEFPDPQEAGDEGLLAFGGDLNPSRILKAYRTGIFPWFNPNDPILWWSPNPRMLLYPKEFKVSKSFRRVLKNKGFEVKFDHNFEKVIEICGDIPRPNQEGTWLTKDMKEAYIELHNMGFAHSVETYYNGELVGGLYGIAMGKAFFGESMFTLIPNASKVALKALSSICVKKSYDFIDCQVETPHLLKWGAKLVDRETFLAQLEKSQQGSTDFGLWRDWTWQYSEE